MFQGKICNLTYLQIQVNLNFICLDVKIVIK